ncbi:MAG: DUF45 domain-containing protein [Candidatus Riflebacteria bacterium]|nr:DUF45 domain-containing protein [Candidatus Riflebacteria bacterium]
MQIPFKGNQLRLAFELSPFNESKLRLHDDRLEICISSLYRDPGEICVHLSKKIKEWLKSQARLAFCQEVERQRQLFGFKYENISIKDTKTRWGSCSAKGNLNFNWRLILVKPEALSYLVTHETAHLSEMNHSHKFWGLVEQRNPAYKALKEYLRKEAEPVLKWELLPQSLMHDINNAICK